ncbi:MAG: aspartate kinase, partial [Anaplasmataceae bacterium]|nr:aspartate kinase [Anaplasmataceae bacterium]
MEIIVKKFGGSSLENISKIKEIAEKIKQEIKDNNDNNKLHNFVIVVSAMAKTTNELVNYTLESSSLNSIDKNREYDSIISAGEQVSSGILALCLLEIGIKAKSLSGWKIPIYTDNNHKI